MNKDRSKKDTADPGDSDEAAQYAINFIAAFVAGNDLIANEAKENLERLLRRKQQKVKPGRPPA